MDRELTKLAAAQLFTELNDEAILQFIWQHQYFNSSGLATTAGEDIRVLHPGFINKNQGPDFTDARIRIGNTVLAGTVEMHLKTSDWLRHRHEQDQKYRNVILHVVFEHDQSVNNIPVVELQPLIPKLLLDKYRDLMQTSGFIPCDSGVQKVKPLVWLAWKERLLVERLTRKTEHVLKLVEQSNKHWEEVFWWMLARNFGMKVNADAFEAIARTLPVKVLAKHKHQLIQLEALLLGQANLLIGNFDEDYPKLLQREFKFLQRKYSLAPVHIPVMFLRMRPVNFPSLRLAQLAALIHVSAHLFSKLVETENLQDLKACFNITANDYWHYHYRLDQVSDFREKKLGNLMTENILINTVIPTLFAYGVYHRNETFKNRALTWLQQIKPEQNYIIKGFNQLNIPSQSAFDSQALIELKNEYCQQKKCLSCAVGHALLKAES